MKNNMIRLWLLLIMTGVFRFAGAQVYYPLVGEDKLWSTWHNICLCGGSSTFTKFEGDTLINGKIYKIVWTTSDTNLTGWYEEGQIREENGKVYYGYSYSTAEFLLYDFSALPGDTLYLHGSDYPYIMDSIGWTTMLNGEVRPVYYLTSPEFSCTEQWIEGAGSNYGVLNGGFCGMVGDDPEMICFTENDILKYQNPEFEYCYVITATMEPDKPVYRIYPNPARKYIVVEPADLSAGQFKLEMADSRGTIVATWQLSLTPATLSLPEGLSPGLYYVRFISGTSVSTAKLVVI